MSDNIIISARNVCKHFAGGKIKALDGVSADIRKGEVVVIIGPSGSGKSTFLRCLNLLEVPTDGQILFNGMDITDKQANINLHRQKMGMVFQHFNLFPHMTLLKNMTLAPHSFCASPKKTRKATHWSCCAESALPTGQARIPASCPADRNSVSPSSARWPWSRRSCSLTNPPPLWTPKWSVKFWKS